MTEIITRPAHEQAALLAAGEISAVELAQAHLDQIEAINPALNAFLHVDADGALATAAEIDRCQACGGGATQPARRGAHRGEGQLLHLGTAHHLRFPHA